MRPLLISHRGDTSNASENTMEAFASAFAKGADGVELDVQLNDNGEVIVVHHVIHDKTKSYPLFEEVLRQFGQSGILEIELKGFNPALIDKVFNLINKFKPKEFSLTSSILLMLPSVREKFPKINIGAIFNPYYFESWMTPEIIQNMVNSFMNLSKANVVHLYPQFYTKPLIEFLKKQGFLIHYHLYTNDLTEYQKALDLSIDRCTFDKISLLEKINPLA